MIISLHRYDCFWLEPNSFKILVDKKSSSDYLSLEFLNKLLCYFDSKRVNRHNLEGAIYEGYNPLELEKSIVGNRWLKEALEILRNKKNLTFDDDPDTTYEHHTGENYYKAFCIEDPQPGSNILEHVLEVAINRDAVVFHQVCSRRLESPEQMEGLEEGYLNELLYTANGDDFDRLYTAEFHTFIGPRDQLENNDMPYHLLHPVQFENYSFFWTIFPQQLVSKNCWFFKGVMVMEQRPVRLEVIKEQSLKLCRFSSKFLNIICAMLVNKAKVLYGAGRLDKELVEISAQLDFFQEELYDALNNLKSTLSPRLAGSKFFDIRENYIKLGNFTGKLEDLINTCIVNKNRFKYMAESYLQRNGYYDSWVRDSIIELEQTMDNARTVQLRLSRRADNLKNEIDTLTVIGSREFSLNYAADLIYMESENDKRADFCELLTLASPFVSEKNTDSFIIARPLFVENGEYEILSKHYLEALYSKSEMDLFLISTTITSTVQVLRFRNPYRDVDDIVGEIEIGKFIGKEIGSGISEEILNALHCDKFDTALKCQLSPISSRGFSSEDIETDLYQYWIGVNCMIAFFEALCCLYNDPRHHSEIIKNENYGLQKRYLLFITGMLCLKAGYCGKSQQNFDRAITLAHRSNQFDQAFAIGETAALCETCVRMCRTDVTQTVEIKAQPGKNPFRTKLVSRFLDVFDLPKAVAIARESRIVLGNSNRIRLWLWSMAILVGIGLLVSAYFIYTNPSPGKSTNSVSLIASVSWLIAFIGAPLSLFGGTWGRKSGKLFPQILFPKNLAAITLTVVSFSFSGSLIISLISKNSIPIIFVLCGLSLVAPALYLNSRFKRFIKDGKKRRTRIADFLNISFLEAVMLSAVCMFIYGPTFEQNGSRFIIKVFEIDWLCVSPIFMLLASLVAVFFGIVVKNMFNPIRFSQTEKNENQ